MSTTTRLITADELLVMPPYDENGNQCRLEVIRGKLRTKDLFSPAHGIICADLGVALGTFVQDHDLGFVFSTGTGFVLEHEPDTVLGIDVSYVSYERLNGVENLDHFLPYAPDLAVDVLSPNDSADETDERVGLYFAAGAQAVWAFDPKKRTTAVYTSPTDVRILGEHDTLDGGEVLPGFKLDLSKLFDVRKK
jgi:Uma2 family endonuclease